LPGPRFDTCRFERRDDFGQPRGGHRLRQTQHATASQFQRDGACQFERDDALGLAVAAYEQRYEYRRLYGTNDPGALLELPPASGSTVLVSQITYNNRGEAYLSTDPAGMATRSDADDAGRTIRMIQNYQIDALADNVTTGAGLLASTGASVLASAGASVLASAGDMNVTTLTAYTPDDQVATLTAVNPATGDQTTRYLYGTTLAASKIARADLLSAVQYPDAEDAADCVQYGYNLQSQITRMQDQNGSVHEYGFDGLGRKLSDTVTTLGAGVDDAVLRIDTRYEIRGMVDLVTSYSDTITVDEVNYVYLTYNEFGQLASEEQDWADSSGPDLTISYSYENGSANTIRRTGITYPYTTGGHGAVAYTYNSGDDDSLSRVSSISFNSTDVTDYTYFGLNSFAETSYPEPGVNNTMATSTPSYPGFDAFNRIVDLPWSKSGTGDIARLKYGYDLASNRTYRQDVKAGSSAHLDEAYAYDGMQRLGWMARGHYAADRITSPKLQQSWNLDATGNWSGFANTDFGVSSNSLVQNRTSNAANEITGLTTPMGVQWVYPPIYDRNGNMIEFPNLANTASFGDVGYDAWNRAVLYEDASSLSYVYSYDGLNRRVSTLTYDSSVGLLDSRFYYYSDQWQVIEERTAAAPTVADRQFVWGLRYIDDLVLRDRSHAGTLAERYYNLADANWNTVALVDSSSSANVVQRFNYTPYGVPTFLDASFAASTNLYAWETLYCCYHYETSTGLYLARNRWFNSLLGCWITSDPLGFVSRDGNLRRYVFSNPYKYSDSSGLIVDDFGSVESPGTCRCHIYTVAFNMGDEPTQLYLYYDDPPETFNPKAVEANFKTQLSAIKNKVEVHIVDNLGAHRELGLHTRVSGNGKVYRQHVKFLHEKIVVLHEDAIATTKGTETAISRAAYSEQRNSFSGKINDNTAFTNILMHEVLYLGILEKSDSPFSLSNDKSELKSNTASVDKLITLSADELNGISKALGK
jgi:RHS repeat-associated protein